MTILHFVTVFLQTIVHGLQYLWQEFVQFCVYIKIDDYIIPFIIKLFAIGIIAMLIYSLRSLASAWIKALCKNSTMQPETYHRIQHGVSYTILGLGIMIGLQNIGIQLTPVITLLGIIGVALGYALKDLIANIIAGVLILSYQPFKLGDYIKIKDWQGTVVAITIRYTTLQEDSMLIFVPNSILYTATFAIVKQK